MIVKRVMVDASKLKNRHDVHDFLKDTFAIPEPFGHNMDAAADVLSEVCEDYILLFTSESLREICSDDYAYRMLLIFGRAAEENPHIKIKFLSHRDQDEDHP